MVGAAAASNFYSCSSYATVIQLRRLQRSSYLPSSSLRRPGIASTKSNRSLRCFSSSSPNGKPKGRESEDLYVKEEEGMAEEKSRSGPDASIASGEFSIQKFGLVPLLRTGLSNILPAGKFLEELLAKLDGGIGDGERVEIPQAKGSFSAVVGQAFFIPLYELYLIYGGIFRLNFGPKSFLIVSDPGIAKHILKDNCKAYSKGILAEILDFVMGKGLITADSAIWRVRRRAIVPALHQKVIAEVS